MQSSALEQACELTPRIVVQNWKARLGDYPAADSLRNSRGISLGDTELRIESRSCSNDRIDSLS